jgi:hypothetical protein
MASFVSTVSVYCWFVTFSLTLSFAKAEIHFSLLAVIKNRIELFEEKLTALKQEKSSIESKLKAAGGM